jgi:secretion/DNA translocation related TadE-like protein
MGGERGSATVLGVGLMVVVLALFVFGAQLGAAVATRHRAEAAADLAALASATHAVSGQEFACRAANRVASHMAARLAACELNGWEVIVRVTVDPPGLIGRFGAVDATARAGPVAQ